MVAPLQFGKHELVSFGPLLLRTDKQKPEDDEHHDEGKELHQHVGAAGGGAASLGRTHGVGYGFKQNAPPKVWLSHMPVNFTHTGGGPQSRPCAGLRTIPANFYIRWRSILQAFPPRPAR